MNNTTFIKPILTSVKRSKTPVFDKNGKMNQQSLAAALQELSKYSNLLEKRMYRICA